VIRERSLNAKNGELLLLQQQQQLSSSTPSVNTSPSAETIGDFLDASRKVRPRSFWNNWWRF
jgi:hypothetical protein